MYTETQTSMGRRAGSKRPLKVGVAGFDGPARHRILDLLRGMEHVDVVGPPGSQRDLERALSCGDVDVAVLGAVYARAPELIERLRETCTDAAIVLVGDEIRVGVRVRLLTVSCLPSDVSERELGAAIRKASSGDKVHLMRGGDSDLEAAAARITPRERDVILLKANGLSNAAIAERLHVSLNTVRSHVGSVYEKLGVKSSRELAAFELTRTWNYPIPASSTSRPSSYKDRPGG